ncbi:MAG: glycosyltransferase family 1 protein [Patescibacteria group bacterium]
MIIGIDLRCLPTDGSQGAGVAHAARFLTEELVIRNVPWTWKLYVPSGAVSIGSAGGERRRIVELHDASGTALRSALREDPCDLLFVPSGSIPPRLPVRAVPWVHDVAIFHHPEWFPQSLLRRTLTTSLFRHGVKSAPFVFAVSEDTKAELVSRFGLDPARIIVTLEGGDPFLGVLHGHELRERKRLAKERVAVSGITNAFVLALGTVEPRKNLAHLVSSWRRACSSFNRAVDLVIAGNDGWKLEDVYASMRKSIVPERDGSRIHRLQMLDDDARRDLLLAADLVAVPSFHEGFGLTALEAMQAETPIIAARTGALPEVIGETGVLLDPSDQEAWSNALVGLMNDDVSRIDIALAGKSRSQGMTWEGVAMKVEEGIRSIVIPAKAGI